MSKKVRGLEFHVEPVRGGRADVFYTFDEACSRAVGTAVSTGQSMHIDVVIYEKSAAKAWGGDDAVEQYKDDPEASVFERIVVKAESKGKVS